MEGDPAAPFLVIDGGDDGGGGGLKELDAALRSLEGFLYLLGFPDSSSRARLAASCAAFLVLGVAVPSAAICPFQRSGSVCDEYGVQKFDICVLVSEASLAAVSLAALSRNLLKYGIRLFLFVDQHHGQVERFQNDYVRKIQEFFRLLLWWIFPCFLVKTAREIVRFIYIFPESAWRSIVIFLASIVSWVYLTVILLSACMLFNLVCNLQIIHFEDYGKLLDRGMDPLMCLEEHIRLRYYLSKISHRFRIFLLLFLLVTVSQFITLFQTTGYSGKISFVNAGDLSVSSVVQVVVIVLCLNAASKISHRAQRIASLAGRWHTNLTCCPTGSQMQATNSFCNLESIPESSSLTDCSESDLESLEDMAVQSNAQLASNLSSYHKRQALVIYLQTNPGGITIFGWTVDRGLLNTIFFLELTLVLFVLSKTIVFPSK